MNASRASVLVLLLAAAAACSSSGGGKQSSHRPTASGTSPSVSSASSSVPSTEDKVAPCKTANQGIVTDVAGGLKKPATALVGAYSVATSTVESRTGEQAQLILAAKVQGASGSSVVGTWAYSDDGIDAINAVAQQYSEWGSAAQPGSPALEDRAEAAAYPETARAASCAAAAAKKGTTNGPSASIGANRCGFPPADDVIYWFKAPGAPATAQLLGAYDYGNCTRTANQAELDKTSPQAAGNCTIVAAKAANPGYNVDADPAPRPKGILAESGPSC